MHETQNASRLSTLCAHVAEGSWLLALATVPLTVDLFADGTFEPPKVRLLQNLALLLAMSLGLQAILRWRGATQALTTLRCPTIAAAVAVAASAVVSSVLSIAPRASWFGSPERAQGAATSLCYVLVFLAIAVGVRRASQVWRLLAVVVAAAALVAAIAVAQRYGIDPYGFLTQVARRPPSSLGNPIFTAAYLSMAAMVALAGALAAQGTARATWTGAAALLISGVAITGSRGPLLGLVAGVAWFGWLRVRHPESWLSRRLRLLARRQTRALTIAVVVLALVTLGLAAGSTARQLRNRDIARPDTIQIRLDAWEATSRAMLAPTATAAALRTRLGSLRMSLGYGLETAAYPLALHIDEDLAVLVRRERTPDRAHNAILQQLAERGTVGVAALLALWFFALRGATAASGAAHRRPATAVAALAVGMGLLVPWLAAGSIAWSGVGATVALLGVVGAATLWRPTRAVAERPRWHQREILMAGIAAALVTHYVELQSGIAVTPTRLLFWALAGLVASPWARAGVGGDDSARAGSQWRSAAIGLAAATALSSIARPPVAPAGFFWALARLVSPDSGAGWLVLACLALAGILAAGLVPRADANTARRAVAAVAVAVATTAVATLPVDLAGRLRDASPAAFATALAGVGITRTTVVLLVVLGIAWTRSGRPLDLPSSRRTRLGVLAGVLVVGFIWNGLQSRGVAAALAGTGNGDLGVARYDAAEQLLRGALAMTPHQARRWWALAQVHRTAIEQSDGDRASHLDAARVALSRATELAPLEAVFHRELGATLMLQATTATGRAAPGLEAAIEHLVRAQELRPASRRTRATLAAAQALRETLR
jgi:hypothetical protein